MVPSGMSNSVTVRGVSIGTGMPKICVPVMGSGEANVLDDLKAALECQPDVLEWRIDWLEDISPAAVCALLEKVRAAAGNIPLLVTFRTSHEGGQRSISAVDYAALLSAVLRTGMADLIDMELAMAARCPADLSGLVMEMRALAYECGVPVIYSYHNFEETPPQDELVEKMKQMFLRGCDIAKIAVMPKSSADVLALLGATEEMKQLFPNCPVITMSMGRLGVVSRLCGETFGSALTFGSAARASAPGQVPALELRRTLELLHN